MRRDNTKQLFPIENQCAATQTNYFLQKTNVWQQPHMFSLRKYMVCKINAFNVLIDSNSFAARIDFFKPKKQTPINIFVFELNNKKN